MEQQETPLAAPFALPKDLALLRLRLTLRLLEDAQLPAFKGALLRGGFGYAFQRATCPQPCWGQADACALETICPYRWVFETPHPPDVPHLHDLQDVPRPFVVDLPDDARTRVAAGSALEFGLTIIGRGVDYLPYFLFGFDQLGALGLGQTRAKARLERAEALEPWRPVGTVIYQDGRMAGAGDALPLLDSAAILARAEALPHDLRLTLTAPLRVKHRGQLIDRIDPAALVHAACWRLDALATFHGGGPWGQPYRELVERARAIRVDDEQVRWLDLERTSDHRGPRQKVPLGGIVGGALLRDVPRELRAVLLAGSLVHVGKACVFGHGAFRVQEAT